MPPPAEPVAASRSAATATLRPFDPRLLQRVPETRRPVALVAALGVASGAVAIAQAVAVAGLVVGVVRSTGLAGPATWTASLFVARGVLVGLESRAASWAGLRVATTLRTRLVIALLGMPTNLHPSPARMHTLVDAAPTAIEPWVASYLPALVNAAVVPVGAIAAMAWLDWRIALVPVLTVPLLPLFAALIGKATAAETDRRWHTVATLSGHFLDVMQGLVTLVNFGRARSQHDTIWRVNLALADATVVTLRTAFLSAAALELLASLSVAIVAVFVGIALAGGAMELAVGLPLILLAPEPTGRSAGSAPSSTPLQTEQVRWMTCWRHCRRLAIGSRTHGALPGPTTGNTATSTTCASVTTMCW